MACRWLRVRTITLPLIAAAVICLSTGCNRPPPEGPLNVLFIVIDTLRWDHVGIYGAARDTTPAIDRLGADAVRFERAYSTAPWTMPSVASMITGLYPSRHGATSWDRKLPDSVVTLAEILAQQGYATVGVVSHSAINSRRNFQQGFDLYLESEARGHEHISTDMVTRQAVDQMERLAKGEAPFFLFVHYFDPHYTYKRHPEIGFAPPSAGRLRGDEPIEEIRHLSNLTGTEIEFIRALYDEEIRFTDGGIQRLLQQLDDLGLLARTLIVLTADHGESFKDHSRLGHAHTLNDEVVRVPLIIRPPSSTVGGTVWREPVSLVALTPTILDLLGVDTAGYSFQGESFGSALLGTGGPPPPVYIEVDYSWTKSDPLPRKRNISKKAIVKQGFKLIRNENTGSIKFFDLSADPGELDDLFQEQADLATQLLDHLDRMAAFAKMETVPPQTIFLDEKEIERLKSLGYLDD